MQKHIMSRYSLSEVIASILASKLASPDLSEAQVLKDHGITFRLAVLLRLTVSQSNTQGLSCGP